MRPRFSMHFSPFAKGTTSYNSAIVKFDFYPLRFEFTAKESLFFPPGKAGNILRGAMGVIFRRIACVADCRDARSCDIRQSCPYARVFEPMAMADRGAGTSACRAGTHPGACSQLHNPGSSPLVTRGGNEIAP